VILEYKRVAAEGQREGAKPAESEKRRASRNQSAEAEQHRFFYGKLKRSLKGAAELITQRKGKKTEKLATRRIVVQLDKLATIRVGELVFTAKPSLVK
jgi:hypothetical protein